MVLGQGTREGRRCPLEHRVWRWCRTHWRVPEACCTFRTGKQRRKRIWAELGPHGRMLATSTWDLGKGQRWYSTRTMWPRSPECGTVHWLTWDTQNLWRWGHPTPRAPPQKIPESGAAWSSSRGRERPPREAHGNLSTHFRSFPKGSPCRKSRSSGVWCSSLCYTKTNLLLKALRVPGPAMRPDLESTLSKQRLTPLTGDWDIRTSL